MNILLTSVGRRAYMVKYFKEALGNSGLVHVSNSDDLTVAFQYADRHVISPLIYDEAYIPFLLNYCRDNSIDILLSLFDIDLYVLAVNKEKFEAIGTRVIVSSPEFISICNDKWKTFQYLQSRRFYVPKTYFSICDALAALDHGELHYPVIVKPRFGCGSIGLAKAYDQSELIYCCEHIVREINSSYLKYESASAESKVLIQEVLYGQEYGADLINDLNGQPQQINIRKKIAMRAGETDIAVLTDNHVIRMELERLCRLTGHIGNIDCDIFLNNDTPYILEMNARFGGGYPFSHTGGCNLPAAIVRWCRGEYVEPETLRTQTGIRIFKELILTKDETF